MSNKPAADADEIETAATAARILQQIKPADSGENDNAVKNGEKTVNMHRLELPKKAAG